VSNSYAHIPGLTTGEKFDIDRSEKLKDGQRETLVSNIFEASDKKVLV